VFIQLHPLTTADPAGVRLNVELFLPLGVLLPLLMRTRSGIRVVTVGLLLSLSIELVQFLADITVSTGRVADIDDVLGNTFGALLGWLLFRVAMLIPPFARIAHAALWPNADSSGSARRDTRRARL
jgi:glycopeptide antibiotics resistance protein